MPYPNKYSQAYSLSNTNISIKYSQTYRHEASEAEFPVTEHAVQYMVYTTAYGTAVALPIHYSQSRLSHPRPVIRLWHYPIICHVKLKELETVKLKEIGTVWLKGVVTAKLKEFETVIKLPS